MATGSSEVVEMTEKTRITSLSNRFRWHLLAGIGSLYVLSLAASTVRSTASEALNSGAGEELWVELFNGRDLDGWVAVNSAPETWSARDGKLHCTGRPISALRTDRQYENFILELEWRHLTEGGNSGIFLWASPLAAPGVPFLRGIEVQILDHGYGKADWFTTHGDVFPIHGTKMTPFPPHHGARSFPSEERSKGSPEWNHYRIECKAGVIRLHVNGKEVSGGADCSPRKGYIALESEAAPVDFRNIRILELPGGGAPRNETAPVAQGHRSLYTGADLRGWRTAGMEQAADAEQTSLGPWQAEDWRLLLNEGGDGTKPLWTVEDFSDAEFIIDCNVAEESGEGSPPHPLVRLQSKNGPPTIDIPLEVRPGIWERFTIRVQGNRGTILRDNPGVEIDTFDLPGEHDDRRHFVLVDRPGKTQFANLYVRELKE